MAFEKLFKKKPKKTEDTGEVGSEAGGAESRAGDSIDGTISLQKSNEPELSEGEIPEDAAGAGPYDEPEEGGPSGVTEPDESNGSFDELFSDGLDGVGIDAGMLDETEAELPRMADSGAGFDLDAQISKMLELDKQEGAAFAPMEAAKLVRKESFFDEGEVHQSADETEPTHGRAKKSRGAQKRKLSKFQEYVIHSSRPRIALDALYIILFVLGIGFTVVYAARSIVRARELESAIAHYTLVSFPDSAVNNSNFIFVNETVSVSGKEMTITKISADIAGTVFYFAESFDPDDYVMVLHDQFNRLYGRYKNDTSYNPERNAVLRFGALFQHAKYLTFYIKHIETGESASFYFHFEKSPVLSQPVYFENPIPLFDGELSLAIEHAVFGSTGTEIIYSLYKDGESENLLKGGSGGESPIALRELLQPIAAFVDAPAEYEFEAYNMIIGKLFFAPVRNRDITVKIEFNDLSYALRAPGIDVNVRQLFPEGGLVEQVFYVGGNKLVLEGMDIQGNLIVLVFHSENPEGERVKTVMEANLIIETDSGFISVPGRCLSNSEGSDVLFNISGVMGEINGIPLTRYGVEIISLQYEIPRLTMNLDLSRAKNEPSAKKVEAELAVWEAFISRLDYKSGMIGFEEITGFTEEILNDRGLMRNYAQNNSEGVPMGAAQIVGGVFAEGNKFLAVVDEEWVLFNKGAEEYFARTHKIIAELKSDGWVIIEDIIG